MGFGKDKKLLSNWGIGPFDTVYIEHTKLDFILVFPESWEKLGRIWLTIMLDGYSKKVLSFNLTFDPPSYDSYLMVIRELVRKFKRIPNKIITVDNHRNNNVNLGKLVTDFNITWYEKSGYRKAVIERLFDSMETTIKDNLIKSNPHKINFNKNIGGCTLETLYNSLDTYLYEIYNNTHQETLGTIPLSLFNQGLELLGHESKTVINEPDFYLLTLPSTKKGTARIQSDDNGVTINTIKYWNDLFKNPKYWGKEVPVKYDPSNIGVAFACIDNEWVTLYSNYYELLKDLPERKVQIWSEQLKRNLSIKNKNINK